MKGKTQDSEKDAVEPLGPKKCEQKACETAAVLTHHGHQHNQHIVEKAPPSPQI